MAQYYIKTDDIIYGPIPQSKIPVGIAAGIFNRTSLFSEDKATWNSFQSLPLLAAQEMSAGGPRNIATPVSLTPPSTTLPNASDAMPRATPLHTPSPQPEIPRAKPLSSSVPRGRAVPPPIPPVAAPQQQPPQGNTPLAAPMGNHGGPVGMPPIPGGMPPGAKPPRSGLPPVPPSMMPDQAQNAPSAMPQAPSFSPQNDYAAYNGGGLSDSSENNIGRSVASWIITLVLAIILFGGAAFIAFHHSGASGAPEAEQTDVQDADDGESQSPLP